MKRLSFSIILILLIIAASDAPQAKVTGECVNCHTMHNSQAGASMLFTADLDSAPNPALTRGDCVGCHAQNPSGDSNTVTGIPQVRHGGSDLAAGNFNYVVGGTAAADAKGHNVYGITADDDGILDSTPPGYWSDYDPAGFSDSNRLVCAGQNGCHGNRNQSDQFAAISGGHHGDDSCLKFGTNLDTDSQGTTVATSYRFLYNIKGAEDSNWQETSQTDHNEYYGSVYASRSGLTYDDNVDTISELCAECHGTYHYSTGIGTVTPWLRHPTDIVLPDSGEYGEYNTPTGIYSLIAPIARPVISDEATTANATVTPGNIDADGAIVMCLSCHRAHASNFYKLMRWDNKANNSGCVVCHTSKG